MSYNSETITSISTHTLRKEGDPSEVGRACTVKISTHTLRKEGDRCLQW